MCGSISYEIEMEDEFQDVFVKDGYTLSMDPSLAQANTNFVTTVTLKVHNDYILYEA